MPFAQVKLDENGKKVLTPVTDSTSTTAADALAVATEAKQTADAAATKTALDAVKATADGALQKSGGEMTGGLIRKIHSIEVANPTVGAWGTLIRGTDNNNADSALLLSRTTATGSGNELVSYSLNDGNPVNQRIGIYCNSDGSGYATCPPPRPDNYGTDIVNAKAMKDYAPMKLTQATTIHVNAETGSDTADLFAGRGFSEEKPFKTLLAAIRYVSSMLVGGYHVSIMLHSDAELPANTSELYLGNVGIVSVISASNSNKNTITMGGQVFIRKGSLRLANAKFNLPSVAGLFACSGTKAGWAHLFIDSGVEVTGNVTEELFEITYGGSLFVGASITGTVTVKKYICTNGGMIIGASKIPGTIDGTCDANSKAFG